MSIKLAQRSDRKRVLLLAVALLGLYVFLPRLASFQNSFTTLLQADIAYIGLGILFWLATFPSAAFVYKFIVLRRLSYAQTLLIQLASGFTNRLAPLGAGAIAINARYLIKRGHTAIQAGALVALNNILGFIGNAILLLAAILFWPGFVNNSIHIHLRASTILTLAIILCLAAILATVALASTKIANRIKKTSELLLRHAFRRPGRLVLALLASMAITASYTLVLYFMGLAFNAHLSLVQSLIVLTIGVLAATVTPTPGGIGGAEAGLVAALISIGISSHQALTVALTYRFLVFWLPILPGLASFQLVLRRRYI